MALCQPICAALSTTDEPLESEVAAADQGAMRCFPHNACSVCSDWSRAKHLSHTLQHQDCGPDKQECFRRGCLEAVQHAFPNPLYLSARLPSRQLRSLHRRPMPLVWHDVPAHACERQPAQIWLICRCACTAEEGVAGASAMAGSCAIHWIVGCILRGARWPMN